MKPSSISRFRVQPDRPVKLNQHDPDAKCGSGNKRDAQILLAELHQELNELQEVLYAEGKQSLLLVLQAMDTAGKDSTIRRIFGPLNPQGVRVNSFKVPSSKELAHDFLWRVHPHAPAKGMIQVFNRSHYEDVLVVKVHELASPKTIKARYAHINAFEKLLADNGTKIVKIFLNISRAEQKERLQERLDRPEKNWKFNAGDIDERALWPEYMEAYETAIRKTNTPHAPWYVVPANRKWSRDIIIANILLKTLRSMKCKFPPAEDGLDQIVIPD
jgi:PPK2 family polyphosphate:nucleotide phosphotransferase